LRPAQEKAGQEFLKRFLAQKDTVTTGEDGKDVCHDDVDDTGKPMYTTETSEGATICAGLRFSEVPYLCPYLGPYLGPYLNHLRRPALLRGGRWHPSESLYVMTP
jgi:hypothetical protein